MEKSWIIICISTSGEGLFADYSQFIYHHNRYFQALCEMVQHKNCVLRACHVEMCKLIINSWCFGSSKPGHSNMTVPLEHSLLCYSACSGTIGTCRQGTRTPVNRSPVIRILGAGYPASAVSTDVSCWSSTAGQWTTRQHQC